MQFGENAKVLIVRQQWRDLEQLKDLFVKVFAQLLQETNIRLYWNKASSKWTLPNAATVIFSQCESREDYTRHHGKSYSLLVFEELPSWSSPVIFDLLRSTLRQPGATRRIIATGNPGGVGHSWVYENYVKPGDTTQRFSTFIERGSGELWCCVHSTMRDNPFLPPSYARQIEAMRERDPALVEAWISGSWQIASGNFFASVLQPARNRVKRWAKHWPDRHWWRFVPGYDHGVAAPAALGLLAIAEEDCSGGDGSHYKRNSVVLVDELHSARDDDPNKGKGWPIEEIAERVIEMLDDWGLPHTVIADDACFADHGNVSIASTFAQYGLRLQKAHKGDRVGGWEIMRDLMARAEQAHRRDAAGFYYAENCTYFADCAYAAQHDESRREDLDTRQADHILDAVRYGLVWALRPDEYFYTGPAPWVAGDHQITNKRKFHSDPRYRERLRQRGIKTVDLSAGSKTFFPAIFPGQK